MLVEKEAQVLPTFVVRTVLQRTWVMFMGQWVMEMGQCTYQTAPERINKK